MSQIFTQPEKIETARKILASRYWAALVLASSVLLGLPLWKWQFDHLFDFKRVQPLLLAVDEFLVVLMLIVGVLWCVAIAASWMALRKAKR